jgi:large subunit ribosomal protein L32e
MAKDDVIEEFTKIKGVGKAKAELLYDKGFNSLDKLKKASAKDLAKVDGITEPIVKNIKDHLKEKPETKPAKTKVSKKEKVEKPKLKKEKEVKPKVEKKAELKAKPEKKEEKPKKPKTVKKEEKEEVETVEEEEEEYKVKKKPKLSKEQKEKLRLRKQIKKRTPEFLREEWFRYKRIPRNWRKPDGISSKMRINLKYRPSKVRVGFRGPKDTRGLHPSGFEEIIVYNVHDLEKIDPKIQAARIGSSVGTKKRMNIEKKAEELEVRILNM